MPQRRSRVDDPATGALIAEVADAGVAEATAAVDAASAAFSDWAASPPRVRSEILRRAYDLMIAGPRLVDRPDLCSRTASPAPTPAPRSPTPPSSSGGSPKRPSGSDGSYGASPAGGANTIVTHRPVGAGRAGDTVELPGRDGDPQDRSRPGRGLHRRAQTGRRNPADGVGDRAPAHRGRRPGRGGQPGADHDARRRGLRRGWPTTESARSPSPDPPVSGGRCSSRPPTGSSTPAWNWAATRRSS